MVFSLRSEILHGKYRLILLPCFQLERIKMRGYDKSIEYPHGSRQHRGGGGNTIYAIIHFTAAGSEIAEGRYNIRNKVCVSQGNFAFLCLHLCTSIFRWVYILSSTLCASLH